MTSRGIGLKPRPGEGLGDPASAGQHRGLWRCFALGSWPHSLPVRLGAAAPQVTPLRWPLGDSPTVPRGPAPGAVLLRPGLGAAGRREPRGRRPALLGDSPLTGQRDPGAARPGGGRPCRSAGCGAPLPAHALAGAPPSFGVAPGIGAPWEPVGPCGRTPSVTGAGPQRALPESSGQPGPRAWLAAVGTLPRHCLGGSPQGRVLPHWGTQASPPPGGLCPGGASSPWTRPGVQGGPSALGRCGPGAG